MNLNVQRGNYCLQLIALKSCNTGESGFLPFCFFPPCRLWKFHNHQLARLWVWAEDLATLVHQCCWKTNLYGVITFIDPPGSIQTDSRSDEIPEKKVRSLDSDRHGFAAWQHISLLFSTETHGPRLHPGQTLTQCSKSSMSHHKEKDSHVLGPVGHSQERHHSHGMVQGLRSYSPDQRLRCHSSR